MPVVDEEKGRRLVQFAVLAAVTVRSERGNRTVVFQRLGGLLVEGHVVGAMVVGTEKGHFPVAVEKM